VDITAPGAATNTINIVANAVTIGIATQPATPVSALQLATLLAADINSKAYTGPAHGFTATAVGTRVLVSAPVNLGATANGYTFASNVTGTTTSTVGAATMAGGVAGNKLTRGMSVTMHTGVADTNKFILKFWRGSFTGNDSEGHPYGGVVEASTEPDLIAQSPEFSNVGEILIWAKEDYDLNNNIQLDPTSVANGTGVVDAADLTATPGNRMFAGGTQTYNTARVDDILDAATKLDYTFVLSLDAGADAKSADNGKILAHLKTEARFQKYMFVAFGS